MFITFEGIDFCGKSTQVNLLGDYLRNSGNEVKIIREPGGTGISENIRNILLDKKNNKMYMETELLLFSASRAQLIREVIKPYLDDGIYVVSDRLHDSTTAYQGFGRGMDLDMIRSINNLAIGDNSPDITFLVDITVDEMSKRKNLKLREPDRMELNSYDFFNRVRDGYLWIAQHEPERVKLIDGMKPIDEIHREILDHVRKYLDKND